MLPLAPDKGGEDSPEPPHPEVRTVSPHAVPNSHARHRFLTRIGSSLSVNFEGLLAARSSYYRLKARKSQLACVLLGYSEQSSALQERPPLRQDSRLPCEDLLNRLSESLGQPLQDGFRQRECRSRENF